MLPKLYSFLEDIRDKPKLVTEALLHYGLKEVVGKNNSPFIMSMAKDLGIEKLYINDEMSWCALFISWLCWKCEKPLPYKGYELVRAASYAGIGSTHPVAWGIPIKISDAKQGDIVVLSRPGGYHIGLLIAISRNTAGIGVHLLGGNQKNSVSIAEFNAKKIVSIRRYYSIAPPAGAQQYVIDSTGKIETSMS